MARETETTDTLRTDVQQLQEDLRQLREDFKHLGSSTYAAGRQTISHARDEARREAERANQAVRECVNEHPVTSLLVAGGVGLLLGALARRP